jgi:hypothetical protein
MSDETNRLIFTKALEDVEDAIMGNLIIPLIDDHPDLDRDPDPDAVADPWER